MKKLVLLLILFFSFAFAAAAQDVNLPRDVAEKALRSLELVPQLEDKIAALEVQVRELEKAKQTPCSVAQEKLKLDLSYWLNIYGASDAKTQKQIAKIIKQTRRSGQRSVAAQCGWRDGGSRFWEWMKIGSGLAPLVLLF